MMKLEISNTQDSWQKELTTIFKMINCNTEKILAIFLLLDPRISNSASPNPDLNTTGLNFYDYKHDVLHNYDYFKVHWNVFSDGVFRKIIRSWSPQDQTLRSMSTSMLRFWTSFQSMTRSSLLVCPCTSVWCGRRVGSWQTTQ